MTKNVLKPFLNEFGMKNRFMQDCFQELFERLRCDRDAKSCFEQWKALFWKTNGIDPESWDSMESVFGKTTALRWGDLSQNPAQTLFVMQSGFAFFLKSVIRLFTGTEENIGIYDWAEFTTEEWLARIRAFPFQDCPEEDFFGLLYRDFFPGKTRKRLGEFYTPSRLAEYLLDLSRFVPTEETPILDPACGSGVFLLAAIRKMKKAGVPAEKQMMRLQGFDLNPLAVLMTKANFAVSLQTTGKIAIRDSILDPADDFAEHFDLILGNPPWVHWDKLPQEYRESTLPLWRKYGLMNLSGKESRYGGAKKELALLMIMSIADRYLKDDGKLAMVLPQSVFQTQKAAEGFRQFGQGSNCSPLQILQVDDFSAFPVFDDTPVKTATILLQKNSPTVYPVRYLHWNSWKTHTVCLAAPVNREKIGSPWRVLPKSLADLAISGPSDYRAILGANTGGANGVFWVETLEERGETTLVRNLSQAGKKTVLPLKTELESELLYPLLRWRDVDRFSAQPSCRIIMTQDPVKRVGIAPEIFEKTYPLAWNYLLRFEELLKNRAAYRKLHHDAPFYSMYNVGPETFSRWKVVWRRMDNRIRAAVTGRECEKGSKTIIPQETCSMIAVESEDEAVYLANILNSRIVDELVRSFSPIGSKGFGSPGMLEHLPIPKFQAEITRHQLLAQQEYRENAPEIEELVRMTLLMRQNTARCIRVS